MNKKGFTFIEVVIVIAIGGILAVVIVGKASEILHPRRYKTIIEYNGRTEMFDRCQEVPAGVNCENPDGEKMIRGTYTMKKVRW